jgi:hypothetical protein
MENTLEALTVKDRYQAVMARMKHLGDQIDRGWYDTTKPNLYYLREELDHLEAAIDRQL